MGLVLVGSFACLISVWVLVGVSDSGSCALVLVDLVKYCWLGGLFLVCVMVFVYLVVTWRCLLGVYLLGVACRFWFRCFCGWGLISCGLGCYDLGFVRLFTCFGVFGLEGL